MNFSDRWATDEDGNRFVFTVEMQRELYNAGMPVEPGSLAKLDIRPISKPAETEKEESSPAAEPPQTIQIDPETGKYLGRLKWFNAARGYGFIARGGGEDIFFHKTGAADDPTQMAEGQWVLYDVEHSSKGPEATDVESYSGDLVD